MIRFAVIGDVHKAWDAEDAHWFNESDYDALLFVGDLPGRSHRGLTEIAAEIGRVRKPALLLPGNHDAVSVIQLIAEVKQNERLIERSSRSQEKRVAELAEALGPVRLVGYSRHPFEVGSARLDVIAARPHSMGGSFLGYRPYLERNFAVSNFEDSARRLKELVDQCGETVLFLAHNGPTGLGGEREAIFGCDFQRHGGDFGDRDLTEAIEHARASGRRVAAVVAGHMHYALKGGGGPRVWFRSPSGTPILNAARVPRIFKKAGRTYRHHVRVTWDGQTTTVHETVLTEDGDLLVAPGRDGDIAPTMHQDFPANCRHLS